MTAVSTDLTQRERELGAIISAYNEVTEQLKGAHERLQAQVGGLREELARKNRQLRRRERLAALGELAAGVAHEIRNPLGGIKLFASLLEKDVADRPNAVRLTGKIIKGVTTLEEIVTDILQFARPAQPKPGVVELERLLSETVELASARGEQQGVRIEVAGKLRDVDLYTDGTLLQRALLNLLLNAVEAAGPGGRDDDYPTAPKPPLGKGGTADGRDARSPLVVVCARPGPIGRIVLSVTDNGLGIPAELMDRIFNPFFTTKATGTGLGLAIVHQIAELLGGTIQAANRREGGAVFSLCLPRRLESTEGE
jgi:signal transduction histidine kinase